MPLPRRIAPLATGFLLVVACESETPAPASTSDHTRPAEGASPTAPSASQGLRRRYDVERGHIEFAVSGMQSGTETLRFKNFGLLEAKHRDVKMDLPAGLELPPEAAPERQKIISIIDGSTIINYDPDSKTGTKTLNSLELLGGAKRFEGKSMVELGEELYTSMGGIKTGQKTIAGHNCDVWKIEKLSTESCIHRGITLEVSTELVGMKQRSVATKVDFSAPVDDAWFVVPEEVTLRETDLSQGKLPAALGSALPAEGLTGKSGTTISPEEALRMMRRGAPQ